IVGSRSRSRPWRRRSVSAEPSDVVARVDPRWDAARVEQSLAALHRRRTRRRTLAIGLGVMTTALVLGAVHAAWPAPTTEIGAETPPLDTVVRLADGSRV